MNRTGEHASSVFPDRASQVTQDRTHLCPQNHGRVPAQRQAVEHYRSALSSRELLSAPGHEVLHAQLLDSLAKECALTGQIQEAFEAHTAALSLWRDLGRSTEVGHTLSRLSRHCWRLGRSQDASRYAVEAVGLLETLPPSRELEEAYAHLSAVSVVESHMQEALLWGRRALEVARAFDDCETECNALFGMGSALLFSGEPEGQDVLEQSLQLAQAQGFEQLAAMAYAHLAAGQQPRLRKGHGVFPGGPGLLYTA